MRYYRVELSRGGQPVVGADLKPFGPWSTLTPQGGNNPGALDLEMDLPVVAMDAPAGTAFLRLWGIGLTVMGQSADMNGADVKVFGGMSKGLPLANPKQSGLLLAGSVLQAYGNWQGTQQTLDLQIIPAQLAPDLAADPSGFASAPKNIVISWGQGQQLGDAVSQTLRTAYPGATITGADTVSQRLSLPYETQVGYYESVTQLARWVRDVSAAAVGGGYQGLRIVPTEGGFRLFDASTPVTPTSVAFTDLIGQPTWLSPATMTFKAVMRADVAVGDYVRMPRAQATTTSQSFSQYRQRATFEGDYQVLSVRHLGRLRQRSADAWVTVFTAAVAS